ncbi:hypothetical protein FKG94_17720 [Exilibacterium tricleocarpae]|uniref:DUF7931 domain-containing protein n=1 Tax=Exilibacterium tricleocarpae TaxID=2591008 RepID=A0A545T8L4_9GAMM|nr:hypothetical protein [Exilibacterium tricleocarpae]TQV73535.1 hypothetical protein FKG94_17720 [Exilibacterium tricleocarpae]
MTERVSSDPNLHLLGDLDAFRTHALEMTAHAQRSIDILSAELDFPLYNQEGFQQALSALARRSRNSRIRILVKSTQPMVEKGHLVAQLAQRLPSKLQIRRLNQPPQDDAMAYLIADRELLLYKNDEEQYQGFANYAARPEARRLLEEFTYLWEQQARPDPQLRLLTL